MDDSVKDKHHEAHTVINMTVKYDVLKRSTEESEIDGERNRKKGAEQCHCFDSFHVFCHLKPLNFPFFSINRVEVVTKT